MPGIRSKVKKGSSQLIPDGPLDEILSGLKDSLQRLTLLTGAGVSAESGIPTFRGPEGYWTAGSRNYQPHEIGTFAMLQRQPRAVWRWFLFRRGVCRGARPNPGHTAIVGMEKLLHDRFALITQNVDGLHLRAGNSDATTYQVHGNLNYMRCLHECNAQIHPIPEVIPSIARDGDLSETLWQHLTCPRCGGMMRPHVLLWDEYYNEAYYRYQTALSLAGQTDVLIVVGTTGATSLPAQVVREVLHRNKVLIVVDIEANEFSELTESYDHGFFLPHPSALILPEMLKRINPKPID
jgi:NAD-dependent deacetylase